MDTGIQIQGVPVQVGERVVYPNGGICRVQGVQAQTIGGREWRMLVLQREEDLARVMVPKEKVESIGLRKVADPAAIRVLFEFLTSSSADPELDWKVRHRENFEKMSAGGLLDTAQVLKGLHALARIRPLPQKEREMYDSARHQLIGEISVSLSIPAAVAENNIDYALSPPPGSGRKAPDDKPLDLKSLRRAIGGRGGGDGLGLEGDDDMLGLDDGIEGGEAESEEEGGSPGNEDVEEETVEASPPKPSASKKPSSSGTKAASAKASPSKSAPAKSAAAKKPATSKAVATKKPAASKKPEPKHAATKKSAASKAPATKVRKPVARTVAAKNVGKKGAKK